MTSDQLLYTVLAPIFGALWAASFALMLPIAKARHSGGGSSWTAVDAVTPARASTSGSCFFAGMVSSILHIANGSAITREAITIVTLGTVMYALVGVVILIAAAMRQGSLETWQQNRLKNQILYTLIMAGWIGWVVSRGAAPSMFTTMVTLLVIGCWWAGMVVYWLYEYGR